MKKCLRTVTPVTVHVWIGLTSLCHTVTHFLMLEELVLPSSFHQPSHPACD